RATRRGLETVVASSGAWGAPPADLTPLQLPAVAGDRWTALEFDTAAATPNERLLYTAHFAVPFNPAADQCGLMLDAWPELVPATDLMSGVTFQFDRPSSAPPHVLLLAVPRVPAERWPWDDLVAIITETMEDARSRAVEPAQIDASNYAPFLPATLMAVTLHQITIATNLAINNSIYEKIGSP